MPNQQNADIIEKIKAELVEPNEKQENNLTVFLTVYLIDSAMSV